MTAHPTILEGLDLTALAQMFKALSNPKRLELYLGFISHIPPGTVDSCTEEEFTVCRKAMCDDLSLAPSTLAHHIKELCTAGLLEKWRDGKEIHFRISESGLKALSFFLNRLQSFDAQNLNRP